MTSRAHGPRVGFDGRVRISLAAELHTLVRAAARVNAALQRQRGLGAAAANWDEAWAAVSPEARKAWGTPRIERMQT